MNSLKPLVIIGAATCALTLAACSETAAETAAPTTTLAALEVAPGDSGSSPADPASEAAPAAADGEQLTADGMPELPLLGCSELVDFTQNETDFDTQWTWEFECRTADPFLRTVEAMNAAAGWTHTVDAPGGNPEYYADKHHYIADLDGVAFDVDLSAMGDPSELEVTYVVTLAKP